MDELINLYEGYLENVAAAVAAMRPSDGIFGIGRKLSDSPCHDEFIDQLKKYLQQLPDDSPSERISRILSFIFRAPVFYQDADISAYWTMCAVHGMAEPLICRLERDGAAALLDRYKKTYSRGERLPVQRQVIKALKERSR